VKARGPVLEAGGSRRRAYEHVLGEGGRLTGSRRHWPSVVPTGLVRYWAA